MTGTFRRVVIVDLPHDPDGAGGTWAYHEDGKHIIVACPECCEHEGDVPIKAIDSTNLVRMKCSCGFEKQCRLLDYGK